MSEEIAETTSHEDVIVKNNTERSRVILLYGASKHGKSSLAEQFRNKYGYHVVGLDGVYVDFIKSRYPKLDMKVLSKVISVHYGCVLWECVRRGITDDAFAAWRSHVASVAEGASNQHLLVVIEGYLLAPALHNVQDALPAVQERLAGKAVVTTVKAINGETFVDGKVCSIEEIHRGDLGVI